MTMKQFFAAALLFCSTIFVQADFYVAPSGNDDNPGTESAPFATLEKARDAARALKKAGRPTGPLTVFLRRGIYELPQGFHLTAEDAGFETAPVTWSRYKNETPILVGGRTVTDFQPHQGKIVKAELADTPLENVYFRQLIFGGRRQPLARYPNFDAANPYGGGWAYADGKPIPMYQNIDNEPKNTFVIKESDFRDWIKPEELQVFVFARYNWWNNILDVKEIDKESRRLVTKNNASYPIRPGDRYYIQNALSELDAPGEWYLDKETKTLYFWPPTPLADGTVCVPTTRSILTIDNCKPGHLVFRGLTFECCEGNAVQIQNSDNITVAACTVRNVGDYNGSGITAYGGRKNRVVGCDIHHVGASGVSMGGGDVQTLTPADNEVVNCYIHHVGIYYKQGVGVTMNGVGNRVAHCLFHDGPRFAVMYSGNNHVIELNEMRHMNLETSDTGATYTGGRNWTNGRGTVIRHNFIHDILGYGKDEKEVWRSPYFAWGVYLDDNAGGCDVIGNIIVRCPRALVHLHNGRDNLIENNVLVDASEQQIEANGWTPSHSYWVNHFPSMREQYDKVKNVPAWQKLRNMQLDPADAVLPDNSIMSGNRFVRNIISYRDEKARYARMRTFNFEHNEIDYNLVWHYGLPILTGVQEAGQPRGENLALNGGFERAEPGKLPTDWNWQTNPHGKTVWKLVPDAKEGKQAFRLEANVADDLPRDNLPIICSRPMTLKPGGTYRLTALMKADLPDGREKLRAMLYLHHWSPTTKYWGVDGSCDIGPTWQQIEKIIHVPGPGEPGYHEAVASIRISIGVRDKAGAILVDDVQLFETEPIDEWTAWNNKGMDRHSIVADPKMIGSDTDRQNLQKAKATDFLPGKDSPAWKLGFKPIPADRIGPYADPDRASWPLVEAEGAREKPLVP